MAPKIKAIHAYRPHIEQGNTVNPLRPAGTSPKYYSIWGRQGGGPRATSLVEGSVDQTIKELRDQVIEFNRAGRAVKVEGLGTFAPSIDLEGNLAISFRPDTAFANGLNVPGIFTGTIINRENIGKTTEELVTRWNTDNPTDQVVFSEN